MTATDCCGEQNCHRYARTNSADPLLGRANYFWQPPGASLSPYKVLTNFLKAHQLISSSNVFAAPGNWKYMLYGLALILMMRFRPEGLLPSRQVQAELHPQEPHIPPSS